MTRSNRTLTTFAISKINEFLNQGPVTFNNEAAGNTSVTLTKDGDLNILGVWLFDQPIVELVFDGDLFLEVTLSDGNFYDRKGRPSRTTRERMNGILDHLGGLCFIPEQIRVFLDPELPVCRIGRLAKSVPFGKGFAPVTILAHPVQLQFGHE